MTTQEVAKRLVQLCQSGDFEIAQRELFSEDAVSIEPYETPEYPKETKGLEAIYKKGKQFEASVEESHGIKTSEPLVAGSSIAFILSMDLKLKGESRYVMSELCVYEVKEGKIVSEQFYI